MFCNAQELSYKKYINLVREESLDIKSAELKKEAAKYRASGWVLPATELGFTQLKENSGSTALGVELSQSIPFPNKIHAEFEVRKQESIVESNEIQIKKNEIISSAKVAYLKAWLEQEELSILKARRVLIENHVRLARAITRSDTFSLVHLMKTESDLDMNENDIIEKEQKVKNTLLNLTVFLSQENSFNYNHLIEPDLLFDVKRVQSQQNLELLNSLKTKELAISKMNSARLNWYPDLTFKFKEMGATSMAGANQEIFVGITLPFLFNTSVQNMSFDATTQSHMTRNQYEQQQRISSVELKNQILKVEALKKQIDNIKSKLIPRAEKRVHLLHNIQARDMETLLEHRETSEVLLDLKLKYVLLTYEYNETIVMIEKLFSEE